MRRRQMLRRAGGAAGGVAGLAGVAGADDPTHVRWQFADGTQERIPVEEFDRRSDTPTVDDLEQQDDLVCCICLDEDEASPCLECIIAECTN